MSITHGIATNDCGGSNLVARPVEADGAMNGNVRIRFPGTFHTAVNGAATLSPDESGSWNVLGQEIQESRL
jgi:hypothetical protein